MSCCSSSHTWIPVIISGSSTSGCMWRQTMCIQVPFWLRDAIARPSLPETLTTQMSGCMCAAQPMLQDRFDTCFSQPCTECQALTGRAVYFKLAPDKLVPLKNAREAAHSCINEVWSNLQFSILLTALCHLCSDEVQPSLRGPERARGRAKSKG